MLCRGWGACFRKRWFLHFQPELSSLSLLPFFKKWFNIPLMEVLSRFVPAWQGNSMANRTMKDSEVT